MTTEVEQEQPEAAADLKYVATFVRGTFHGLRELSWDQLGRSIVISEAQMLHLEQHAVDFVTVEDGDALERHRFEFEPYDGDKPVGYRFPTEDETAKAEAVEKSRQRARKNEAAKALVDAQMAAFDHEYTPSARARFRPRQS